MGRGSDKTGRGDAAGGIPAVILRWAARIGSLAAVGLLLAFLVGEGPPPVTVQALFFPCGVLLGLILAWRFERTGGLLAVASLAMFYVMELLDRGAFPKGWAFLLLASPGALFVSCGFLRGGRMRAGRDTA